MGRPAAARPGPAVERVRQPGRFDGRALEEAGYFPHDVEEIRKRWEQAEAELRSARRPLEADAPGAAWVAPQGEQQEFDSAMREMLGDDDYDAGRFATGRDNRVEIGQIPEDSVAVVVGLQEGDLLIAYDGTPIYTADEYLAFRRRDRALGTRDVVLTVERAGRAYDVVVPGGEIWASFRNVRVPPR